MNNPFFEQPILNTPYGYPGRHWELDDQGQPTQRVIDERRKAKHVTPIPKPKKHKKAQRGLGLDGGLGFRVTINNMRKLRRASARSAPLSTSGVICRNPLGASLPKRLGC